MMGHGSLGIEKSLVLISTSVGLEKVAVVIDVLIVQVVIIVSVLSHWFWEKMAKRAEMILSLVLTAVVLQYVDAEDLPHYPYDSFIENQRKRPGNLCRQLLLYTDT
ncbi:hypothetical protein QZH41_000365 [Actinostola sp. cb2023]|nr:hypothetical protein QZH41_000365 [Actinostola sp. cb2023]